MTMPESETPRVVLASRRNAGILVLLLWASDTNSVAVVVRDDSTDDEFELLVEPDMNPLHVYEHPYATPPALSPLADSNRRPPPYHGSSGAGRASTVGHARTHFSCRSRLLGVVCLANSFGCGSANDRSLVDAGSAGKAVDDQPAWRQSVQKRRPGAPRGAGPHSHRLPRLPGASAQPPELRASQPSSSGCSSPRPPRIGPPDRAERGTSTSSARGHHRRRTRFPGLCRRRRSSESSRRRSRYRCT